MEQDDALPVVIARHFEVTAEELVAETAIARIWKVRDGDGEVRAVKLWADGARANEGPGVALMRAWSARAVVDVLGETRDALLMEWLPGPLLAESADDLEAAQTLGAVARSLHGGAVRVGGLVPLADWFKALLEVRPTGDDGRLIGQAQQVLRGLLSDSAPPVALHGDLHHGNVARGLRGWCAIDAKGLMGDPAYELANAFAHPVRADVARPERIEALSGVWAASLGVERDRLLRWAFAKAALSLVWAQRKRRDDPRRRALMRSLSDRLQR